MVPSQKTILASPSFSMITTRRLSAEDTWQTLSYSQHVQIFGNPHKLRNMHSLSQRDQIGKWACLVPDFWHQRQTLQEHAEGFWCLRNQCPLFFLPVNILHIQLTMYINNIISKIVITSTAFAVEEGNVRSVPSSNLKSCISTTMSVHSSKVSSTDKTAGTAISSWATTAWNFNV